MAELTLPSFTPEQRKWLKERYPDIRFLSLEPFVDLDHLLVHAPDGTFHRIVFPPSSCCFRCSGYGEVAYATRFTTYSEKHGSYVGWAVEKVETHPHDSSLYFTTITDFRKEELHTEFYLLIFLAPLHIPVHDAHFYTFVTATPYPYATRVIYTYDKPLSSTVDYSITYWSRFIRRINSYEIPSIFEECSKNPIDPSVDFDSIAWYAYPSNPASRFVSQAFSYLSPRVTKYFEQSEQERFEQFKQEQKESKNV